MVVARVRAAFAVNDVLRWLVSEQPPLMDVKWRLTIFFGKMFGDMQNIAYLCNYQ